MTSMRSVLLVRSVGKTITASRSPFFHRIRLQTVSRTIPQSTSFAINKRFYSSAPPDDIKVYTFKDIDNFTKSANDKYIIDVREPGELQQEGKIPSAINIPLSGLQESLSLPDAAFHDKFEFAKPDKTKEVIFYCKAGVRSTNASLIAKEAGYTKIGNYKGSFDDWLASKGTVAKAA